jgi:hypothetical protein
MAQAVVDVLAAQRAPAAGQEQLFERAVRADQRADGAGAMLGRMSCRPLATYSSAVCQSTSCHWPPCLSMGLVRRSALFSAS